VIKPSIEPTWDSSSSSSPDLGKESYTSSEAEIPESNLKLVEGAETYVLATAERPRKLAAKRRQSGHRREFHNVPSCSRAVITDWNS